MLQLLKEVYNQLTHNLLFIRFFHLPSLQASLGFQISPGRPLQAPLFLTSHISDSVDLRERRRVVIGRD
jgi:hypothetical protein